MHRRITGQKTGEVLKDLQAEERGTKMKVLLEEGVWLTDDDEGDPPRTLVEENAKEYASLEDATKALAKAREYRPFKNAEIQDDLF